MFLFMENLIKIFVEDQRQPFSDDVLQNSCSTLTLGSLFNKLAGLPACYFMK